MFEKLILISIVFFYDSISPPMTVFDDISRHLEVQQKYTASRRIFLSLLGVWKCGQTRSFVFAT